MDPLQRFINDSEFLQSLLSEKNEEEDEEITNFLTKEYIETLTRRSIDNILLLYSGNYFFTVREFIKIAEDLDFFICDKLKEISLIIKHNIQTYSKDKKNKIVKDFLLIHFEGFYVIMRNLIECLIFYQFPDALEFYLENDDLQKNEHEKSYLFYDSLKTCNINIIKIVYENYKDFIAELSYTFIRNLKNLNTDILTFLLEKKFLTLDLFIYINSNIIFIQNEANIFIFSYLSFFYKRTSIFIQERIKKSVSKFIYNICCEGNLELFYFILDDLNKTQEDLNFIHAKFLETNLDSNTKILNDDLDSNTKILLNDDLDSNTKILLNDDDLYNIAKSNVLNNRKCNCDKYKYKYIFTTLPLTINGYMGTFSITKEYIVEGFKNDNIEIFKILYEFNPHLIYNIKNIFLKVNNSKWMYDIGKININDIKKYCENINKSSENDKKKFYIDNSYKYLEWILGFNLIIIDNENSMSWYEFFARFNKNDTFEKIKLLVKYEPKLIFHLKDILKKYCTRDIKKWILKKYPEIDK